MNVMYLDPDPAENARLLCDKHLCAQINEALVMLRGQWPNHPATKWAHASDGNWDWLWSFAFWCCVEYHHRFRRVHASLSRIQETRMSRDVLIGDFTPPTFHGEFASYREYLSAKHAAWAAKGRPAKWTRRERPETKKEADK